MKMFKLYSLLRNVAVDLKPRNFPQAVRAAGSLVNEERHQLFRTVWIWMFSLGRFDFNLDELEVVVFVKEALARRNDWDRRQHVGPNLKKRRKWNETNWSKALTFIPAKRKCKQNLRTSNMAKQWLPACLPAHKQIRCVVFRWHAFTNFTCGNSSNHTFIDRKQQK